MKLKVKLDPTAFPLARAHEDDAGLDIRTPVTVSVPAGGSATIDTGIHMEIPRGYYGRIAAKSGLNVKHDLTCDGVIDSGYTGSIVVKLYNHSRNRTHIFKRGDKIAQIVIEKCYAPDIETVDTLTETERGDGGFGSTGR